MQTISIIDKTGAFVSRVVPNCSHPIVIDKHDGLGKRAYPCGKCARCLSYRRNIWNYRLNAAKYASDVSFFATLTYDDEHLSSYFLVDLIQKYHKRLRKALSRYCAHLSYYFTSEYGSKTHRPHHHALYFITFDVREFTRLLYDDIVRAEQAAQDYFTFAKDPLLFSTIVNSCWRFGFVDVAYVSSARVNYITHYHSRPKFPRPLSSRTHRKPFVLSSRLLGWSDSLSLTYKDGVPYIYDSFNGVWLVLPHYYRKKLNITLDTCVYLTPDYMYDNSQDVLFLKSQQITADNKYNLETF